MGMCVMFRWPAPLIRRLVPVSSSIITNVIIVCESEATVYLNVVLRRLAVNVEESRTLHAVARSVTYCQKTCSDVDDMVMSHDRLRRTVALAVRNA
jgi:hypothetical protein